MNKYGLCGKIAAVPGKRKQLASILERAFHRVQMLDGCLVYIISEDANDETSLWSTEIWVSKEAHSLSLQDETVKGIIEEAMPLIDGSMLYKVELHPLFGVGLPQ